MTRHIVERRLLPKRILSGIALIVLIMIGLWGTLNAQSVSQGYGTDETLQKGMLVKLKPGDGSKVVVAGFGDGSKVYGVVVNANDAPVTLSNENNSVFVASTGRYEGLVSDENGALKTGDYLALSHIDGVAMKASESQTVVVGKALVPFDGKENIITSTQVDGKNVHIARIQADFTIGPNPLQVKQKTNIPGVLQNASQSIANKPVEPLRIYIGAVLLLFTLVVSGSMLYAGVKSSITAIGRNPLSKRDILRSLLQVTATSIIVFIIGVIAVYLLLIL